MMNDPQVSLPIHDTRNQFRVAYLSNGTLFASQGFKITLITIT
jgi:hypothetical protein